MVNRKPDPEFFWPDGTVRSQGNAFTSSRYSVDMTRESAAAIAGANSAATKRARGQELIPRFNMKGSTPRARKVREKETA